MTQLLAHLDIVPFYVSQELLYLYRAKYVKSLAKWLDFPLDWESPLIEEILKNDANAKYIKVAEETELDRHVKLISSPTSQTRSHPKAPEPSNVPLKTNVVLK